MVRAIGLWPLGRGPIGTGCIQPKCPWLSRFPGLGPSVAPRSSPEVRSDGEEHKKLTELAWWSTYRSSQSFGRRKDTLVWAEVYRRRPGSRCSRACLLVLGVPWHSSQNCVSPVGCLPGYSRLFFEEASVCWDYILGRGVGDFAPVKVMNIEFWVEAAKVDNAYQSDVGWPHLVRKQLRSVHLPE